MDPDFKSEITKILSDCIEYIDENLCVKYSDGDMYIEHTDFDSHTQICDLVIAYMSDNRYTIVSERNILRACYYLSIRMETPNVFIRDFFEYCAELYRYIFKIGNELPTVMIGGKDSLIRQDGNGNDLKRATVMVNSPLDQAEEAVLPKQPKICKQNDLTVPSNYVDQPTITFVSGKGPSLEELCHYNDKPLFFSRA